MTTLFIRGASGISHGGSLRISAPSRAPPLLRAAPRRTRQSKNEQRNRDAQQKTAGEVCDVAVGPNLQSNSC
jgi:hypothetical protein